MPTKRVTRVLLSLSRGGADAIHVREFDLLTETFVDSNSDEMGFVIPEGKTRARYKSRNVLLVGADTGVGSMTTSGYPRTVREWKRGTKLIIDAPIVFEGEDTDVSCSQYIYDETHRALGAMYEVQSRSISFYNSLYFVKMEGMSKFVKLAIAMNTEVSFFGRWMILKLKDDWEAVDNGSSSDTMYKSGSLIYLDSNFP